MPLGAPLAVDKGLRQAEPGGRQHHRAQHGEQPEIMRQPQWTSMKPPSAGATMGATTKAMVM